MEIVVDSTAFEATELASTRQITESGDKYVHDRMIA
jgi:hypothetical protein